MRTSEQVPDVTPRPPKNKSTVVLLLATIADTTWRMFVPTLGLVSVGLWADTSWGTGPLWSLTGIFTGSVIAGFLIRQQFKNNQDL